MIQNLLSDTKVQSPHDDYVCCVNRLTKVYDKESRKFIFKSSEVNIIKVLDNLKIYYLKKNKEYVIFNLCSKHTFINRVTDVTIPRIDSCRIVSDPFSKSIVLSFPNPGIANDFEVKMTKQRESCYSIYANINFLINVTNKCHVNNENKSASVYISGLTTGTDIRKWVGNEFNISDIHIPKYEIQLQINADVHPISDEIPLLILYEHLSKNDSKNCSNNCYLPSVSPNSSIYIDLIESDGIRTEIFYPLEEKWKSSIIPKWLMHLLSDLYFNGPKCEGIFRMSARDSTIKKWYKYILEYEDFVVTEDMLTKAALLKYFIRNIKGSIMTSRNRREITNMCKKIVKITAEEFLTDEKRKEKLIKLIKSLPKTHLFLLQNLLVILQAITNSDKTMLTPFSIARSMSPSIFPIINLFYWKHATKLFEAIVLLTDDLVSQSTKEMIIKNFSEFNETPKHLPATSLTTSDEASTESSSASVLSSSEANSKFDNVYYDEICENLSEGSSIVEQFTEEEILDCSECEDKVIETVNDIVSTTDPTTDHQQDINCAATRNVQSNETGHSFSNDLINTSSKSNICIEVDIKDIHHYNRKSNEVSLSDSDALKENDQFIFNNDNEDQSVLTEKSLFTPDVSTVKEPYKSASAVVSSSRTYKAKNKSSKELADFPKVGQINRNKSRRALSEVLEPNKSGPEGSHRSRSPNVKNLIRMYEERNKPHSGEASKTESEKNKGRLKKIPENMK